MASNPAAATPVAHSSRPAEDAAALRVEGLSAGYRAVQALDGVSFDLPRGSLTALIGPNGAGKSTLFQALLGLIRPWSGTIQVAGRAPGDHRFAFGYLPQHGHLDLDFPVTVRDVVVMGRYARLGVGRRPGATDWQVVARCLDAVNMTALSNRGISELSGGQRQRVLLARALAQEAPVLLLDEPVSGVDALSQQAILALLRHLAADGTAILVATHDLASAAEHFDRAICLNRRVIAAGPVGAVLTEPVLNTTFESRMALVRIEGKLYAVDTGGHG